MQRRITTASLVAFFLVFVLAGPLLPRIAAGGETDVFVYKAKHRVAEELMSSVSTVLTSEGRISVDSRTNSLVIVDTPKGLAAAKTILASQDVRQSNIQITVESVTDRDLQALHAEVDWAYRSSGWQIGTVPVALPGSGFSALAALGDEKAHSRRRSVQTITVMNDGTAEIATGHEVPFTDVFHHYAAGRGYLTTSTRWVSIDTGLTVHARTIGEDRILLDITPWMRNLARGGRSIKFTEASTQIEVKDGEAVVMGSSTQNRNEALREILRGGSRVREGENTYLMVTARKR